MRPTEENVKKLILGLILAHLPQIYVPKFFSEALSQLEVKHCSKLSF